ncbi:FAD/NAD(P)-binding domain-containing protein [Nemania sp. NC0429]|nr:FAD/NAD(P)-binding domain-containing protein [Nemania sp. NC0429]
MATIDVAIIGGGPAGLTAAATLARQLHTAVVFDTKTYRNANATSMHMVPGWENKNPQEFRSTTKNDILSHYSTIQFSDVGVTKIDKQSDSHFKITDADGKEWNFRKVILAVGSSDSFPDLEGFADLWTKRIFHCLFCHGYEDKGASSVGVLAIFPLLIPALAMNMADNAAQLGENVTIYTSGNEELASQLSAIAQSAKSKFTVEARKIKRLAAAGANSVTVEFEDGGHREEKFLAYHPLTTVQGPFVAQLGLTLSPMGDIQADASAFHQTNVRGVFAAGDCITPYKVIPGAISSGCNAAVAATTQLQAEKYGQPPMF